MTVPIRAFRRLADIREKLHHPETCYDMYQNRGKTDVHRCLCVIQRIEGRRQNFYRRVTGESERVCRQRPADHVRVELTSFVDQTYDRIAEDHQSARRRDSEQENQLQRVGECRAKLAEIILSG